MEEGLPREKSKKSLGKRRASFASESATKRPKKWPWISEAVEILLKYSRLKNSKLSRHGLRGMDFRCMAVNFLKILNLTLFRNRQKNSRI